MNVGWSFAVDGNNQDGANASALVWLIRSIRPARLRFHRPMNLMQGFDPATAGPVGAYGSILLRAVSNAYNVDDAAGPPPLDYFPYVQLVTGYGPKMPSAVDPSVDGYAWAHFAGYTGTRNAWEDNESPRTDWLALNYNGYQDGVAYSRPPRGEGDCLWLRWIELTNLLINDVLSTLTEAGWPATKQSVELWNEALPGGIGGRGLGPLVSPWAFDDDMIEMLDFLARGLDLDPDGQGKRTFIASTLVGWNGSANYELGAPEGDYTSDFSGGEITRSLACIDEWHTRTLDYHWAEDRLFDAISLNPYAPPGDNSHATSWGSPDEINPRTAVRAMERKLGYVNWKIRSVEGAWFQHLPIIVSEYGLLGKWCSMDTIAKLPPRQDRLGELRLAASNYLCSLYGPENVCVHTLHGDEDPDDMDYGYNAAYRLSPRNCFNSARSFLRAVGYDTAGPEDMNGNEWLTLPADDPAFVG